MFTNIWLSSIGLKELTNCVHNKHWIRITNHLINTTKSLASDFDTMPESIVMSNSSSIVLDVCLIYLCRHNNDLLQQKQWLINFKTRQACRTLGYLVHCELAFYS